MDQSEPGTRRELAVSAGRRVTLLLLIAVACAAPKRNALPPDLAPDAKIPGIEGARGWADDATPDLDKWMELTEEEIAELYPAVYGKEQTYLLISGGGSNGAYGAGILAGMTESGKRPEFSMVTGISTGALIALFAFVGPKYDAVLKEVYTTLKTKDLVKRRGLMAIFNNDAVTDSTGLRNMIAKYITAELMQEIAAEYRRGRGLYVATTNLDAGRAVIWNIGRIAASGSPDALQLTRDVLLASASIPAAFPPVMIEVEVAGKRYDEMHVDGGATAQVFFQPGVIDMAAAWNKLRIKGKPTVYVIRNGFLKATWRSVERKTLSIAGRSIDTMIRTQGEGDLYRVYFSAMLDGMEYRQTAIPDSFTKQPKELFDPEYMSALYELGRELGRSGKAWKSHPPEAELILEGRKKD
jgi:predicted acylesterase/phospholipase RssA